MTQESSSSTPPPRPSLRGNRAGTRAIEAIVNAGYNLHQFSKLAGAPSYQTLVNWKNGVYDPSIEYVTMVSEVTGYGVSEIVGDRAVSGEQLACRYAAWAEFERTPEYQQAPEQTRRQLAQWRWEPGYEPSVSDFMLFVAVAGKRARR